MFMRCRLGDDIDDFCVKCKRVMNHLVVSLLNDGPAKVRCRTCHSDHDFRHEQAPPPRVDARKSAIIQQALEKVAAAAGDGAVVETEELPTDVVAAPSELAPAVPIPAVPIPAAPAPAVKTARKSAKAK
jgi:hypothetical protein